MSYGHATGSYTRRIPFETQPSNNLRAAQLVFRMSPTGISVVTTTLAIYCGLSQSLQTNTKMAHQKLGHDHCHILSIHYSPSSYQRYVELLPAPLCNLWAQQATQRATIHGVSYGAAADDLPSSLRLPSIKAAVIDNS
jgi:hypothetical protein